MSDLRELGRELYPSGRSPVDNREDARPKAILHNKHQDQDEPRI
jgi:hypothetical protein